MTIVGGQRWFGFTGYMPLSQNAARVIGIFVSLKVFLSSEVAGGRSCACNEKVYPPVSFESVILGCTAFVIRSHRTGTQLVYCRWNPWPAGSQRRRFESRFRTHPPLGAHIALLAVDDGVVNL